MSMATTTENSSMFSLEMLTKQAPPRPAEPEEAPAVSLPHAFAPVLATPAPVVEEKGVRVRGWVFVAAFVAFIAPVVGVVAVLETKAPAASHVERPSTTTVIETSTSTETSTTPSTTTSTSASTTPVHHTPRTRPVTTTTTATVTTVKREAPKCCPGETEMQCAMRRSVGATCG